MRNYIVNINNIPLLQNTLKDEKILHSLFYQPGVRKWIA